MNELFGQPYILSVSSLQDFFFSSGKILASPDSPLVSRIAFCFEIFFSQAHLAYILIFATDSYFA